MRFWLVASRHTHRMNHAELPVSILPAHALATPAERLTTAGEDIVHHLDSLPAFAAWPTPARRQLAAQSRIVTHTKGQRILACGEPCQDLIVILRGTLMSYRSSVDGRQNVMAYWRTGDLLGLAPIFSGGPFSFDLYAQRWCKLLHIPATALLAQIGENPRLIAGLIEVIHSHYRLTIEMFCRQTLMSLRERVVDRLLYLADTQGRSTADGLLIDARLSQTELAAMLSTTRQSVNKELRWLASQGLITLAYNAVTLTDLAGLRQLCPSHATLPLPLPQGPVSPLSRALLRTV